MSAHCILRATCKLGFPLTLASSSGARSQASVHHVSQLHSGIPLLLAGDSNIWFPFFQLGRSRLTFCPLCRRSSSLILWFFGTPLILPPTVVVLLWTSFSLSTPISVHSGLNCCPFAPLCCPLLSSDHMLCSCRLDTPRAPFSPSSAHSPLLRVHDWSTVVVACHHNLSAWRNGSWHDFRRSGSPEDQARFHLLRQKSQHSSFLQDPFSGNEWLGSVPSLSSAAPSGPLVSLLTLAICSGIVAWSLLLRRHVPFGAPIFPPPLGTLRFQTNFPALFLSASRLSRLCTNLADLMRPSLTTNSLLHSPSTSLHQARTACHTLSSKSLALGGVIFCFLSSTLCYGSLWFRPHGSPALSFRSSSEMVTPLLLILTAPFLASCAFKLFEHLIYARIAPPHSTTRPFPGRFPLWCRRHGFQPRKHLAPPPSRIHRH